MRLARLAAPLFCLGTVIAPLPSRADVLIGDSGGQEDTGANDDDDDDDDKDGCSAAPLAPTSVLSLGLGLALLGVLRRRQQ